ncbi:MAG: hypothetical protein LH469_07540, partial [Frankiaceae bacterium]|nr:hypothetical protein [Frankiaceae bacterium]
DQEDRDRQPVSDRRLPLRTRQRLVPHHPDAWARTGRTSLADTVWICDRHHHDLHTGHKTLRLRDRRWLHQDGWTDRPAR